MKFLKLFSLLFLFSGFSSPGFSQNGNAVVSEVQVYDLENGYGRIEVRISGNLATSDPQGTFTISGDIIPGGSATGTVLGSRELPQGPGNAQVILSGSFPISNQGGSQNDIVEIELSVPGTSCYNRCGWTRHCKTVWN